MNQKLAENKKFFDAWAGSYDWPLFQFWMRRFYRPLVKEMKDTNDVLDVSCGSGEFLQELGTKTKARLQGIDFSEKMACLAQQKLSNRATITQGNVHHLPHAGNTFDYVVSTESFHHYYDQPKALEEMKRVAKPNGKVVVVDIHFFLPFVHWLFERFEPGCVKIHSKNSMRKLFEDAGLQNIQQQRSFLFAIKTVGIKK